MTTQWRLLAVLAVFVLGYGCSGSDTATPDTVGESAPAAPRAAQPAASLPPRTDLGTIQGHVMLVGKAPGNRVIRMSMDPKCAGLTEGQLVVQEEVAATPEGDLANVFVQLDGDFPAAPPAPATPVRIDQVGCVYVPRVVGVQVGQTLEIMNSDDLAHNLHASSSVGNGFNVGQPRAGMVYDFVPEEPEMMLHVSCDVHRWMTTYVGIVSHPYFDVSGRDGTFTLEGVPAGTYTIHSWHEVYGELTQTVEVRENETTMVDFEYMAAE